MAEEQQVIHEFPPVYDEASKVLILGSFPSVKSREMSFYYGHPQNRFWKVIAALYQEEEPKREDIEGKKRLLYSHHIALWDVIASCTIIGSSDSSIKNVVPNDIASLLQQTNISHIYANGAKAYELYKKYVYPVTGVEIQKLPSTSPANAAYRLERLCEQWKCVKG
jgi:hypoxanthine-DNA glycosylase